MVLKFGVLKPRERGLQLCQRRTACESVLKGSANWQRMQSAARIVQRHQAGAGCERCHGGGVGDERSAIRPW